MDKQTANVPVRLVIPNVTEDNRNQIYRTLYYYLKSKFEASLKLYSLDLWSLPRSFSLTL